ncbi:hypothetical protein LEP1GSC049_3480 [Leptospira kirschneri serovar Cynopteri str. 3522 CT]|nr:hypothetical protein LEP1GSC044_3669 [Leptospira kirschneri serovar Grippotyphosa str. RM52]EKP06015.1 hypothetical protein LEP1GSC018_1644 [Leptospira kirschneri str. 2008720114]EKQ84461.1 hypothetical protein LEP1GSC064_1477 [Leptospira kirschneri serovar Grippotyphosa str. Moskva]EKR06723.1 hypothetical protein LEP1GSC122_1101 [Leptospira kirschneri serovar Valbuzzi str. 200702274]EMK01067.1 hypothetical protein LEP1GSC176_0933 [Leptospira kirschneri str. MMD1493]EMK15759.1 hypothetical 
MQFLKILLFSYHFSDRSGYAQTFVPLCKGQTKIYFKNF